MVVLTIEHVTVFCAQSFIHIHTLILIYSCTQITKPASVTKMRRSPARRPQVETATGPRPNTAYSSELSAQARPAATRTPIPVCEEDAHRLEGAASSADVDALLAHPLVRDLIRENETMLMELAVLREVHARCHAMQQQHLFGDERAGRAEVCASEATARAACTTASQRLLVHRVVDLARLLAEEEAAKEELRSFAELAQTQLDSSLHGGKGEASKTAKGSSSDSPPIKARRSELGSGTTEGNGDSRRPSLEEITNLRGSVKRLRSVESSESGTPRDQRNRLSGAQRSPGALTKVRKTMQ